MTILKIKEGKRERLEDKSTNLKNTSQLTTEGSLLILLV